MKFRPTEHRAYEDVVNIFMRKYKEAIILQIRLMELWRGISNIKDIEGD